MVQYVPNTSTRMVESTPEGVSYPLSYDDQHSDRCLNGSSQPRDNNLFQTPPHRPVPRGISSSEIRRRRSRRWSQFQVRDGEVFLAPMLWTGSPLAPGGQVCNPSSSRRPIRTEHLELPPRSILSRHSRFDYEGGSASTNVCFYYNCFLPFLTVIPPASTSRRQHF